MHIPRKTKLIVLIPISILSIAFLVLFPTFKTSQKTHIHLHIHKNLQIAESHCDGTLYPELCVRTLAAIPYLHKKSMAEVVCHTLNVTEDEARSCESDVTEIEDANKGSLSPLQHHGLEDCHELLKSSVEQLKSVYRKMTSKCGPTRHYTDMVTFLSATMTNQYTCMDGFAVGSNKTLRKYIQPALLDISHHISNSLVMLKKVHAPHNCSKSSSPYNNNYNDDDLAEANQVNPSGYPGWMKKRDRHLLQNNVTKFDFVVAKDGTGNFSTIGEAVAAAKNKSETRIVIYIKAGAYFENIEVDKKKSNIMFLGDGIGKTVIKGNRNVIDGWTTFRSATLGYPRWMKRTDKHLLQNNITQFDIVVAKDETGDFLTIGEAVEAAMNKSDNRIVIYIKEGAYFENVEVGKNKTNIMFLGDGIGFTVIKGNRSVYDGWTTFRSATLAVVGSGFIAKGITVENYAEPSKHQAVALRSGSDHSAFYQCSFVGYQDTLYTHSLRQFYRECDIYGTVDFIFGNAAVVFQNSNLYARVPLENQQNIFTAQGRQDPNQNTGISILNCKVTAAEDLALNISAFRTYLGRPWKLYSRTVFMLSYISDVVDPAGWSVWLDDFALDTLYYAEYNNRGPGSDTSDRVMWPGYRVITNASDVSNFTVGNFLQGSKWLPSTDIPFYLNLTA